MNKMAECLKMLEEQLKNKNVKRDLDVRELYLAEKNLTEVIDLSRFKNLKFLYLNGNKIRRLNCLTHNFRLSELYLQDNCVVDITGTLSHLQSLEVLFLHNNQLEKLDKVIKELKSMQALKNLNLFDNPVAQEPKYRVYVVYFIPSLILLDRQEITDNERKEGREIHDQENSIITSKIGFGRRSEGPPNLYYPPDEYLSVTKPDSHEVGNNFYRDNPPYDTVIDAVKSRTMNRAVMEYTTFDWTKVPRAEQRRLSDKPFNSPQCITTRFR